MIASKFERTDGSSDLFFLRFANKSVVAKIALDTEEEARFIQVDEHRWYAVPNLATSLMWVVIEYP